MQIIKQLSNDEFVIKLEDTDKRVYKPDTLLVAHDYVQFNGRTTLFTDSSLVKESLTGPYARCSNCISISTQIQIGIREFIEKYLPFLNHHEYCQKEHLLTSDKQPNYTLGTDVIRYFDTQSQQCRYWFRKDGSAEWSDLSQEEFNLFLNNQINFDISDTKKEEEYFKTFFK